MKSMILVGLLLVLSIGEHEVHSRAIDDMDNSIQGAGNGFEVTNWVEMAEKPPATYKQQPGEPIELVCEVLGSPTPSVQWIHGSMPLNGLNDYKTNIVSEENPASITRVRSVLYIPRAIAADTTFTCVGQSGGKTVFASTLVKRSIPALLAPYDAMASEKKTVKITHSYLIAFDLIGSNIVLPCRAYGHPRPEIYWTGKSGVINGQDPRMKVLPSGELLITDLKWEDMGNYKCVAQNSYGNDSVETFVYPVLKEE